MLDIKSLLFAWSPFVIEEEDTTVAKNIWRGDAQPVKQITTCTFGTVTAGETFGLVINRKVISYTVTAATDQLRLDELVTYLAATIGQYSNSTLSEFAEITAVKDPSTGTITGLKLTGPTNGAPFTVTSWSGGQTVTFTATQAPTGPNWFSNAANWSLNAVPTNGDEAIFENNEVDCLYGLEDASTTTLAILRIKSTYTGRIGLLPNNENGYVEYRPLALKIGATKCFIGEGDGTGSQFINLDFSAIQNSTYVAKTANAATGPAAVYIKGTHASNKLYVYRGQVGLCALVDTDAATATSTNISYIDSQDSDAKLHIGSGVTLTTHNQVGGEVTMYAAPTTVNQAGGTLRVYEGNITTLNVNDGTAYYNGEGTIAAAVIGGDGTIDLHEDMRAKTFTAIEMERGASYKDPNGSATVTNGITLHRAKLQDVTIETKNQPSITFAS
jgi:hypothetical protein